MRIDGLSLVEVALYARGSLADVAASRTGKADVSKEGPALSFLRGCDAYDGSIPTEHLKGLAIVAMQAGKASLSREAVMRAVTFVTCELTGRDPAPRYDEMVAALAPVKCVSGGELVGALNWHKKTGQVFALSSIAMSLAFWLRRAERWDLAPKTLAILMGIAVPAEANEAAA